VKLARYPWLAIFHPREAASLKPSIRATKPRASNSSSGSQAVTHRADLLPLDVGNGPLSWANTQPLAAKTGTSHSGPIPIQAERLWHCQWQCGTSPSAIRTATFC
jgi:hypothetical protein